MLFNTIQFGVFFAVVLALYFSLPHRWQNWMLLAASYFFYGCWDYRFLSLIFISTTVDFYVGKMLDNTEDDRKRKLILFWSVLFNLGFLGVFKYYGFFVENLKSLLETMGIEAGFGTLNIVLPVGISFYTFQSMSYTLDIYRRQLKPTAGYLDFALFVAYFPQMVAGPIERAQSLIKQVVEPRRVTLDNITEGFYYIVWGLFKKIVVADNMAKIADPIFAQTGGFTAGQVIVGCTAFAFQIYGDFSGYSDIARGTARVMGFKLMVNFNLPYFAVNIQDFWRRWHISLSTWLRDYLYISLGGNRRGEGRTYVNLMLTMVLGGLWHGASWTFVVWGLYQGTMLCLHRLIEKRLSAWIAPETSVGQAVWRWVRVGFMFGVTLYGWLLFRAKTFGQIHEMTWALFSPDLGPGFAGAMAKIVFYSGFMMLVQWCQFRKNNNLDLVRESPVFVQTAFYLVCFYMIVILGSFDAQSFIYFQF